MVGQPIPYLILKHTMNDGTHNERMHLDRMGDTIHKYDTAPDGRGRPLEAWKWTSRSGDGASCQPLNPPPNPRHVRGKTILPRRTEASNTKER